MSHILLLYAPPDQAFARQLAVQLEQRGLIVWPVPDLNTPPDLVDDLDQVLEDATHVLGILSPDMVASEDLMHRCDEAREQGKRLIGVLHRPCELPEQVRQCTKIDFQGQFLLAVEDLVKQLSKTGAPTHPLSVVNAPPVAKPDLLPISLPSERCWREDRLRINYNLPIIMPQEELELRLPAFFVEFDFELLRVGDKAIRTQRLPRYKWFDPRRAQHTLTVRKRKGNLEVYYRMTRTQVYHWFPVHYRVLDREAAMLYRYLVMGKIDGLRIPVDRLARRARLMSWTSLVLALIIVVGTLYLILI
ncbi:MAG: toll/interleukin-1 receptor domain-containing protein [Chloroflexi bacterium]|nr:toll/interleukin-1 receptor domain-containing protein [Chloroflexota bacterium]